MCFGRYSFGRWTIVEAILFFFNAYFFKVSFEKLAWRRRKKKIYIVKEGVKKKEEEEEEKSCEIRVATPMWLFMGCVERGALTKLLR